MSCFLILEYQLIIRRKKKVFENYKSARKKARMRDDDFNSMIEQIVYLHFTCNVEPNKIAELYLLNYVHELKEKGTYEEDKRKLLHYINHVINLRN